MLRELTIKHIGLIDEAKLELANGLTVLTGETGAGKTMLMTALGLVLGQRAESAAIATGQNTAELTALFVPGVNEELAQYLSDQGLELEADGELLIRRQLTREETGTQVKSRAWVNGTAVPVGVLGALGEILVEHQTQHAATALLAPAAQREAFDGLAGATSERKAVAHAWQALRAAEGHLQDLMNRQAAAEKRQELLVAWLEELDSLCPVEGEFDTLSDQRATVMQQAQTAEKLAGVTEGMEAAVMSLREGSLLLDRMAGQSAELEKQAEVVTRLLGELEDVTYGLARFGSGFDGPEMSLEQLDDRLHAYKGYARKHQVQPQDLHGTWELFQQEQGELADMGAHLADAQKAVKDTKDAFVAACATLTAKRAQAAPKLVTALTPHLRALNLPHAEFSVDFAAAVPGGHGAEDIVFMFTANPGQPAQPLGKVASGGELSRVLLALKAVTYVGQAAKTIVLDEADTGIGGATAAAVGAAMAALARGHQVLTITHHPQVAAHADHHLKISKLSTEQTTRTSVTPLTTASRVEELARMLAGQQVTDAAREAAQNLLTQAQPKAA